MEIDHLAVVCADLDVGSAWLEQQLGVPLQAGGQHDHYGTHNRLLGLGPGLYLEVIAPNPAATRPDHPRWFGLDDAPSVPCLGNWIARTNDMSDRPDEAGHIVPLQRGNLEWEITVPEDGSLCEGGAFPSLIRWGGGAHPSAKLIDRGVRLLSLEVSHPEPARIKGLLTGLSDDRVRVAFGPAPGLTAGFETPNGLRTLG